MSKINRTELVTILTCVILWIFIYIPVISYHLNKYRKRGTNMVYLLRYSNITVIQSILFIFKLIFGIFSHTYAVVYDHFSLRTKAIQAFVAYIAAFFLYCFVWKFWLLRYNIMLNKQIMSFGWKQIINAQHTATRNSFYPKHKRTCGSMYCSMYIFMILAIITTTLYVFGNIFYDFYASDNETNPFLKEIYAGWDYIVPFILLLIIYFTTPSFEDNFYIHSEMKYIFICLCIQYIVYYGNFFLLFSINPTDSQIDILWTLGTQIVYFVQFCTILISTYWVNNKCDAIFDSHSYQIYKIPNKLQLGLDQKHCIEIQPQTTAEKKPLSPRLKVRNGSESFSEDGGTDDGSVCLTLYEIMANSMTYNAFINHLSKEYSIECLLSLTEMIQFREYLINRYTAKGSGYEEDKLRIKLASDIPNSYIVMNKAWNDKEKAYKLYTKYVRAGSELQINISAEQRQKYDELMGNYCMFMENGTISNDELISLFVPCCKQMIYLMIDSRKRFQQTPIYTKLIQKNNAN